VIFSPKGIQRAAQGCGAFRDATLGKQPPPPTLNPSGVTEFFSEVKQVPERLKTRRTQIERLLDPKNDITLSSLQRAAAMAGHRVSIELVRVSKDISQDFAYLSITSLSIMQIVEKIF